MEGLYAPYVAALVEEIRRAGGGERVATIFFGGGTPSILPVSSVARLLRACREAFAVRADAEISLEANPGTVDVDQLSRLRELGFNRLSLGVQSAQYGELALLGRSHTFDHAVQTVGMARAVGFENLSLDLIYGLPHQSLSSWQATLDATLELSPDHLSAYCLSVEDGTPLADWVTLGKEPEPDPDLAAEMYELTQANLGVAGYFHYEISNWARLGRECQHNLIYWRDEDYLGFGAGAHSHRDGRRWWNVRGPADYIARIRSCGSPEAGHEGSDPKKAMGEMLMMGLRLSEGVQATRFRQRFGQELFTEYGSQLEELLTAGLIESDGQSVRLTARGRLLGNQVFLRFLT